MLIDPHGAAVDPAGNVAGGIEILGPDGRAQAQGRTVGLGDHIIDAGKTHNRQNRAEGFFVDQRGAVVNVAHHGQGDEIAGTVEAISAGNDPAGVFRFFQIAHYLVQLSLVLDRPELAFRSAADAGSVGQGGKFVAQSVIDVVMHVQALDDRANLPAVEKGCTEQ
ncbi:hypothetical protein D3C84_838040 [compost metagenome]